jgi:thiamine biosynthesis lipoprotein
MGTEARIVLFARDRALADAAATAAYHRIAQIDRALSDYRVDSEVAAVAAAAGQRAATVGDDFLRVLAVALDIARETGGAFDPTAGPLTALWREARRAGRMPDDSAVARATRLVGWQRVHLDTLARTVRLATPGMRLDFGGIAKGFAADAAIDALTKHGAPSALVAFGGEIVAGDPPPGEQGWAIDAAGADAVGDSRRIAHAAISASGDTEQFIEIDGVRHSHVLDPRTGRPLTDRVAITVFAADGMTADAFATAAGVLDSAALAAFIAGHPLVRFEVRRLARRSGPGNVYDIQKRRQPGRRPDHAR